MLSFAAAVVPAVCAANEAACKHGSNQHRCYHPLQRLWCLQFVHASVASMNAITLCSGCGACKLCSQSCKHASLTAIDDAMICSGCGACSSSSQGTWTSSARTTRTPP
eukprot:3594638-Rhodomonas_salina.1